MNLQDILLEGIKITNGNEAINLIKNKSLGVKIPVDYINKAGSLSATFDRFINKCKTLKIPDYTYGVQFLVSHVNPSFLFKAINNDAIYEFLKSYRKPWVKQLPIYNKFINSQFDESIWHEFEKTIQEEQAKHGKASKGKGLALEDVKNLYNDGTWSLLVPTSFNGEKAAAYYGAKGNEKPCKWCTRANLEYYNYYTSDNTKPLYIIKNSKTGKSYQIAFTRNEYDNKGTVHFLDQEDVKGDEITNGDLNKIPDNLLKFVKDAFSNKTLLDYKNTPKDNTKFEGRKYIKAKDVLKINDITPKKIVDDNNKTLSPKKEIKMNGEVIIQRKILNFAHYYDSYTKYFNTGEKISDFRRKKYACVFYFKKDPTLFGIAYFKDGYIKTNFSKEILRTDKFNDKENLQSVIDKSFDVYKKDNKFEEKNNTKSKFRSEFYNKIIQEYKKIMKETNDKFNVKEKLGSEIDGDYNKYFEYCTNHAFFDRNNNLTDASIFTKELILKNGVKIIFKKNNDNSSLAIPCSPEKADCVVIGKDSSFNEYDEDDDSKIYNKGSEMFDYCKNIMNFIRKELIKIFYKDVQEIRGNTGKTIYESKNYFKF